MPLPRDEGASKDLRVGRVMAGLTVFLKVAMADKTQKFWDVLLGDY